MYDGHLENKTTIKVQVFGDVYLMKYMVKTADMFEKVKSLAATKLAFLSQNVQYSQVKQHKVIGVNFRLHGKV